MIVAIAPSKVTVFFSFFSSFDCLKLFFKPSEVVHACNPALKEQAHKFKAKFSYIIRSFQKKEKRKLKILFQL